MYILQTLDLEELAKLCINIADNRKHYNIPAFEIQGLADKIDTDDTDKFNIFEGELAIDIIYGNSAYIYTNAPFNIEDLRRQIEFFAKNTLPSYICKPQGDYTCTTKLGGFRPIWIELETEAKKPKPRGRQSKEKSEKAKQEAKKHLPAPDSFIFLVKPLTIEELPDWKYKISGDIISDEENVKQMLSIVIDDQKNFSKIPARHIDTPLSYHLTNSEYLIPFINLHVRYGVRYEIAKLFHAAATKHMANPLRFTTDYIKDSSRGRLLEVDTVIRDGRAYINNQALYRSLNSRGSIHFDKYAAVEGFANLDTCFACHTPLYEKYYIYRTRAFIVGFCAMCGEFDPSLFSKEFYEINGKCISTYPRSFQDVIQMIPKLPYIPENIFENYKRTLLWLHSQPYLDIINQRVMFTNEFLKIVQPTEVIYQLQSISQERKFILPVYLIEI